MLGYNYAKVDDTGRCYHVYTTNGKGTDTDLIRLPLYHEDYLDKYYLDGVWFDRKYNEYTPVDIIEDGEVVETMLIPVIESGYVDEPWEPTFDGLEEPPIIDEPSELEEKAAAYDILMGVSE